MSVTRDEAPSGQARILRPCAEVRFRIVAGEGVIIRQVAGEVLVVNEVGARILTLLDGRRTLGQVAAVLLGELEVEEGSLLRDLATYAGELLAAGVVEELL